jgi:hypothetical protein
MIKINFLQLGVMALIFGSCCDEDYMFENNHHIKTEDISVKDFSKIKLENVANVYVTTGESISVEFTAYENILDYMDADVYNDELVLKFRHSIDVSSNEEIRVDITMPELEKVTLSGVGNFYIDGPKQDRLDVDLNGIGNINAFDLPVYKSDIDINGTGNVKVQALDDLNVDINGIGKVYYQGSPKVSSHIHGLGDVIED